MPEWESFTQGADPLLAEIIRRLREMDTAAYLVGGAVRDWLLAAGRGKESPAYDLDFAVSGDGVQIARHIADRLGVAFYPLDAGRGVGRIVLTRTESLAFSSQVGEEGYGWKGKARVIDVARFQGPDLAADLAGRDFAVNAMALDVTRDPPRLIDPHGGQADLEARQLRAVSDQAIQNDPVRGLRAVRQAVQLGFEIEPHTQALIRAAAPGLAGVSAERIRDELVKILALPGAADHLRQLDALRLLAEILPEVTALKGLAQSGSHRWDAYEHTLQAVAALEGWLPLGDAPPYADLSFPDRVVEHLTQVVAEGQSRRTLLTLAALLHDIGKRDTAIVEPDGRTRFIDHERVGAGLVADALRRLRFAGDSVRLVETVVHHHLRPLQLAWGGVLSKRAIYRFFRDTGDAGVEVALLSLADHRATVGPDPDDDQLPVLLAVVRSLLDAYFNRQGSVVSPLPLLTGRDLIHQFGLQEGPTIGRLLNGLREAQATGEVKNRGQAEAWIKRKVRDWGLEIRD